ncbi:MAG: AmmeMemoRadiSam system protein B, partial [Candidatus Omnitrophica bacterium]|nr:AmmeMemoRadiSam system protein B [Candidatus Omnitrophota bacterium]
MALSDTRKPVVAGQFYPGTKESLNKALAELINPRALKNDVIACMLPHAGYMYSGKVAGETVSEINIKSKVILLGPNHTGYGNPFSIMTKGSWETPLGAVNIDSRLAAELLKNSKYLKEDKLAHENEHSLEVELPFLQYLKKDFAIVPIAFMSGNLAALKAVGEEIARVIIDNNVRKDVLIVASSDMTHYEPLKEAESKDREAIDAIISLDADRLMAKVKELDISMCGYAPAIVMITSAKLLGAKIGKLVKYQTSGDTTRDFE